MQVADDCSKNPTNRQAVLLLAFSTRAGKSIPSEM
jgi:hypothetical protein